MPFMALWPHKSCLAETHGTFAPDRTDLLRARLPGHTAALSCHIKTGQVESDLPFFFSIAMADGPFLCLWHGETNSSQVFSYTSSPVCALAIGLTLLGLVLG
jgi:hypothetical protein